MSVEDQEKQQSMVEPIVICPSCKKEIRLTESLAAPLVEATRRQYEQKLAEVNSAIGQREAFGIQGARCALEAVARGQEEKEKAMTTDRGNRPQPMIFRGGGNRPSHCKCLTY